MKAAWVVFFLAALPVSGFNSMAENAEGECTVPVGPPKGIEVKDFNNFLSEILIF